MPEEALFERYGFEALVYKRDAYELDNTHKLYRVKKYGEMWMLIIFVRSGGRLHQVGPRHIFYHAAHAIDFVQRDIKKSEGRMRIEYLGT